MHIVLVVTLTHLIGINYTFFIQGISLNIKEEQIMVVFTGNNPTELYKSMLYKVLEGEECSPRGKLVKEVRPACVEFLNPLNRVTFLKGRAVNPFFQLAESLWIISGKSDVAFLEAFNKNMASFSDDGKFFNASYGERIRFFTKNDLHHVVINPIDQLEDAYLKLKADPDTRQAVIVISNPMFDNYNYTVGEQGKDIACNLVITFKIRDNKLEMSVFNRSNDLHWGLFGANLAQFSTIQETLAAWLGIEVGTYTHITDSLHVYLDDYGHKITDTVLKANEGVVSHPVWKFETEPRMSMNFEQFDTFLSYFWGVVVEYLMNDDQLCQNPEGLYNALNNHTGFMESVDDYWKMAINAMIVYRLIRMNKWAAALYILSEGVPNSQWKVSMLSFVKPMLKKRVDQAQPGDELQGCYDVFLNICENVIAHLVYDDEKDKGSLVDYLLG